MFNRRGRNQSSVPRGGHYRSNRGRYEYRPVGSAGSSSTNTVQIGETTREYQQCVQRKKGSIDLDKYSELNHNRKGLKGEQMQKALLAIQDLRYILQLEVQEASPYNRSDCVLGDCLPIFEDHLRRVEQCENILNELITDARLRKSIPEEPITEEPAPEEPDFNYDSNPWSSVGLDEIRFANLDNYLEP